jgi:hypothetical protein
MNSTTNIHQLAGIAYNAFERIERGEDYITTLKDDAPEWVRDLVRAAHGDMLPDDWRYDAIRSALWVHIHNDESHDLDEMGTEWADGYGDVYTGARLKWLASNLNRPAYCDEAREEGLSAGEDIVELIGAGQYMEAREVWGLVVTALEERAEELEDESEES